MSENGIENEISNKLKISIFEAFGSKTQNHKLNNILNGYFLLTLQKTIMTYQFILHVQLIHIY